MSTDDAQPALRLARRGPFVRAVDAVREKPLPTLAAVVFIAGPLCVFLLGPIGLAIGKGFVHRGEPSLYWFTRVFSNPALMQQLYNGVLLACTATGISLVLAVPLALLRARTEFRGLSVLSIAVLVPLILPPFVGALAMKRLLSRFGAFNLLLQELGLLTVSPGSLPPDWLESGFWGVAVLQALHLFPILYLNASAALANIDPAYSQAARNLGAGPLRTFFRITLPLMRPGLFAGGTIVFIWSFTDIGTPLILNYRHLIPVTIFEEIAGGEYTGRTFSLVFILLAASVLLYVAGKFVFGRAIDTGSAKATVQSQTRRLGIPGTIGAWVLFGVVLFVAILPHVGVILTALSGRWIGTILPGDYTLGHLRSVVTDEDTYSSILNSLRYAGLSTLADLLLGGLAAWLIVRSRVIGRQALDALVMLPLAVPGLILAAGYIAMTVPGSAFEALSPTRSAVYILVIAYSVRRIPFVVRGVSAGLEQVPVALEEAARNLGSSKLGAARRVTFPLILANIIAAGVLTFAFAMLEVSDSLVLAQRRPDYPITKQIYTLFTSGTGEATNVAAALGVYGMLLLGGTMALASALLGKRLGAIFRA